MKYRASFPKWRSSLDTHPGIAWNKCPLQMELAHTCFALSLVPVIQAAIGWSFHLLEITHCVSPRFCSACSNMVSDRKRIAKTSCEVTKSFFPRLIDRCRFKGRPCPISQLDNLGWLWSDGFYLYVFCFCGILQLFRMSKSEIMRDQDMEVYSNGRPWCVQRESRLVFWLNIDWFSAVHSCAMCLQWPNSIRQSQESSSASFMGA